MRARLTLLTAGAALLMTLVGCATGGPLGKETAPVPVTAVKPNGVLHGGEQPVSGAAIQVYAVGTTGLGSAATALAANPSYTDAGGQFYFPSGWSCTANTAVYGNNPEVYLVATGGNPGLAGTVNNTAIAAMVALGPCSTINANTYVSVNELTTVAAVYALSPFMQDVLHIGAQGVNPVGMTNAFAMANEMVNTTTGTLPGLTLPANATMPVATMDTLADLIAVCINTDGTGGYCSGLFGQTTPANGTAPADTIAALHNIVRSPGSNVAALYNMVPPASPFQPTLRAMPNDWTLAMNLTGGGLSAPAGLAIDAGGNAWIANAGGNSLTGLSASGAPLTGSGGYTGSGNIFGAQGVAVDRNGNVWLADSSLSTVVEVTVGGGAPQGASSFTGGGISGPTGIAIDSQNNVWVSNFAGGSVTELNSSGAVVGGPPLTAGGELLNPLAIGIDGSGNVWTPDDTTSLLTKFSNAQALLSGGGLTDGTMLAPTAVALDAGGRAWVTDGGSNSVSLFSPAGASLLSTPLTGGGLNNPSSIALDGNGTAWVANAGSVAEISASAALSPATGFGVLSQPMAIAVDSSGNVWTANAGDNSVSVFIGIATPAVTPLAAKVGP